MLHISSIASEVLPPTTLKSYVDDTRVQRPIVDVMSDCSALQSDLQTVYSWAKDVAMTFNGEKFEALRYWPGKILQPEEPYLDPDGQPILEKQHLRDLGVEVSNDCNFSLHVEKTVATANKLIGGISGHSAGEQST